jgi:hypothetical protein
MVSDLEGLSGKVMSVFAPCDASVYQGATPGTRALARLFRVTARAARFGSVLVHCTGNAASVVAQVRAGDAVSAASLVQLHE